MLASSSGALASFFIVPRHVLGGAGQIPPSEKVNVASIGAGGMAEGNIARCQDSGIANIVALCDVHDRSAKETYKLYPDVKKYRDFRVMLEKQEKEIDAVIIATPDHTHAVATLTAMKLGKHVYTQKPLTHDIYEARILTEAAKKYKVATQMGNQGHSGEGTCLIKEWVNDGALGQVREIHCWTDRPGHRWPQGIARFKDIMPVPEDLDWDLWLGTAPTRPYHEKYAPFSWRGFWDFGTGALGDMGCHIIDQPFDSLQLGYPTSVEGVYTVTARKQQRDEIEAESPPTSSIIRYEFPARGNLPAVTLFWYDGGLKPFRPRELDDGRTFEDNGFLLVGDQATLMAGCYGLSPCLIPDAKMKAYKRPAKTLPRVEGGVDGHEKNWLMACKGQVKSSCPFEYAGPLTETVLLGNLTLRSGGKKLLWDGPNMTVTNCPEANQYVRRDYRRGWSLEL